MSFDEGLMSDDAVIEKAWIKAREALVALEKVRSMLVYQTSENADVGEVIHRVSIAQGEAGMVVDMLAERKAAR